MKKLIVLHHPDYEYDIGGLVRALLRLFNTEKYRTILLEKYKLEVITSIDILHKINKTKNDVVYYINEINNCGIDLQDSIVLGIHPNGLCHADRITFETKKIKNIKTVAWINDPHYFAYFVKDRKLQDIAVQEYTKNYDPLFLEKLDYLLSPSLIYFENLNITKYNSKLVDMFYFLPPDCLEHNFSGYTSRKNQIILSGARGKNYISRVQFRDLKAKTETFNNLIYVLNSPGYKNNEYMTEMNYYNKLSEYKGAFVGHHAFPLNYLLAKHIEVLMCGCLGFFEPNPLLESQLGLKEFVHYIPCYSNGKMIEDNKFYEQWLEHGETIAKQGQQHVIENFGEKQIYKLFSFLSSI